MKTAYNEVNQSKREVITYSLRKVRENTYEWITIGFGFTPDWMKKWREFFEPIA